MNKFICNISLEAGWKITLHSDHSTYEWEKCTIQLTQAHPIYFPLQKWISFALTMLMSLFTQLISGQLARCYACTFFYSMYVLLFHVCWQLIMRTFQECYNCYKASLVQRLFVRNNYVCICECNISRGVSCYLCTVSLLLSLRLHIL